MPQPSLNEVRRHARLKGIDAEAVPQSLRHGGHTGDASRRHDGLDVAPRRCAAPAPEAHCAIRGLNTRSRSRSTFGGKGTCRTTPRFRGLRV